MRAEKTATAVQQPPALSRPTLCLGCHLLVEMTRGQTAWHCPRCQHIYPFRYWKIKAAGRIRR